MKKIFYLFLGFIIIGLGTISCNNDDNKPNVESQHLIVGSWEYSKIGAVFSGEETLIDWPHPYPECTKNFLEFANDGKLYIHEFNSYDDLVCEEDIETALYSISNNILTFIDIEGDEEPIEFTIMILNETTLKMS